MARLISIIVVGFGSLISLPVLADGVEPVTSGQVVRGANAPPPRGPSGSSNGRVCDFANQPVDQYGNLTGTSVQCGKDDLKILLSKLPDTFNSYCVVSASRLKGRLIQDPIKGNPNHCDLSAMTPQAATQAFGGGKWK